MIFRRVFVVFNLSFVRSKHLYHKNMTDAYLRYVEPSDRFDITFTYNDVALNVCRKFNLKRSISETVNDFSARIKTNVDKVVSAKFKRKKKSQKDNTECEPEVIVKVLKGGETIDGSKTCKEVFFSGDTNLAIDINNNSYKVLINPPWVDSMSLPQNLMVGFWAYPIKFDVLFGTKALSTFIWFKSNEAGEEWKEVSSGPILYISNDFLGCKIKLVCIPGNGEISGPEIEAESNAAIKLGPADLPFTSRQSYTTKTLPSGSFRVVSYNILADGYAETEAAKTELFPYLPQYARNIDYRKQLYIKELIGYNADIICLQECDVRIFNNDLTHGLIDYEGHITPKKGTVAEGVATLYAKRKFRLLETKELIFSDEIDTNPLFSHVWEKVKIHNSVSEHMKERSTVFHCLILEGLETSNIVVVGNTHLFFHPDADHIRLIQGGMAMLFMEDIINSLKKSGKETTLIFCGDMNSTPDCGLYLLMTEKKAPSDLKDWRTDPKEVIEGLEFSQPFEMRSAYGTPPFTNYTEKFSGCLDYIYYQSDVLKILQTVPIPDETVLKANTALPSPVFPSDHVSLIADFTWDTDKCKI